MNTRQNIIIEDTLERISDIKCRDYLCHVFCHDGYAVFNYNDRTHKLSKGDCMIIPGRLDLISILETSRDFNVEAIYITQEFIDLSTPPSNYGTRGHLSLFENPVMELSLEQQRQCAENFANIRRRLEQTRHNFQRDILVCAVQAMILDFFDFHASIYGTGKISAQQHELMQRFIQMLERGDSRRNRDIGYYADMLCITPKYLSEVCKKASGLPAAYWITRYTALDISRQLKDRSNSLSDICEMFSFSSLSHFSRYVQNNLGAKPSELRE